MLKPIKVWVSAAGPNPWKPVIILEELNVPYELELLSFEKLTAPEYKKINPTGKVPAIYDPNTDVSQWESGAIVLYLIEQYDTENKLTYTNVKEKALLNQWLMFQMSQQGPFYGQLSWFSVLHAEHLPSAIARYSEQVSRILSVLNGALEGKKWLVGDKCTYADLAFIMWNAILPLVGFKAEGVDPLGEYLNVKAWQERMRARSAVAKVLGMREECMKKDMLGADGLPVGIDLDEMRKRM